MDNKTFHCAIILRRRIKTIELKCGLVKDDCELVEHCLSID